MYRQTRKSDYSRTNKTVSNTRKNGIAAEPSEVLDYIKSCSYPNNKAKHLVGMAQKLIELFDGKIPDDVEELQKLPGVGRKTANVIASVVFNKPAMAVDTHVFRVAAQSWIEHTGLKILYKRNYNL
jgi:endonuclease III